MPIEPGQVFQVVDAPQRTVGVLLLETKDGNLLAGRFTPAPAFADMQQLFQDFEEAVHLQGLRFLDPLVQAIAALGLHLEAAERMQPFAIGDVQIWSDGGMSCQLRSQADLGANDVAESAVKQPVHK